MTELKKKIDCEKCGKFVNLKDACFVFHHFDKKTNKRLDKSICSIWCTKCQNKSNPYWVGIFMEDKDGILDCPEETVDTLGHLHDKIWFDADNFIIKLKRLRSFSK